MTEKTIWEKLAAEFPKSAVSWRAQSLAKSGDKAMALAYLDSRDVRRRLNEVLGPGNWQNRFYDCGDGKLACEISVRVDGEWISKSDGAGETQVEAEKGAFSGALKRAAVAFGIGEYLYDMPTPWVPCEAYESNGKKHWSKWIGDPWEHVRMPKKPDQPAPKPLTVAERKALWSVMMDDLKAEAPKGWRKMAAYITDAETQRMIETLGSYKQQFLDEARAIVEIARDVEKQLGEPVGGLKTTAYNFDQLENGSTVGDMLDATQQE